MSKQVQDSKNDEELVEAIARRITRDRYRYCLDGSPLSDEWRDKYAENSWHEFVDQAKSALAVAKPEIERALLMSIYMALPISHSETHYCWRPCCLAQGEWLMRHAKERGIDLEEKT